MKLIDILVRNLPGLGGWPKDKTVASHGPENCVMFHELGVAPFVYAGLKFDGNDIVTKEEYESALAASKPEWNGEGLPPVGSRVEVRAEDFEGGWVAIDVVYVHNGEVAGIVQSENEYLNDRLEKFSAGYNRAEFRPIRSEADKKRDDITQSILDVLNDYDFEMVHIRSDQKRIATDIVERIASSMIPHIRID